MPLYEYQCQQCEHRFEVIQRLSEDPLTECPQCGGELKKLISAPAVQFKGSGWYVTDYARKSSSPGSSSSSESGKDSGKDSGTADKALPTSDSSDKAPSNSEKPAKADA